MFSSCPSYWADEWTVFDFFIIVWNVCLEVCLILLQVVSLWQTIAEGRFSILIVLKWGLFCEETTQNTWQSRATLILINSRTPGWQNVGDEIFLDL
jgi:hypothetical protein